MAMSMATQESMWLQQFEREFFHLNEPIVILCDNKGAIFIANDNVYSSRSKHIDIKHHFIKEKCMEGKILVRHVGTELMVADGLTKPLANEKFIFCRKAMGLNEN